MSYGTVQAEKMTTESGYSLGAGNASSFKNRIINGNMVVNQYAPSSSVSSTAGSTVRPLDRFYVDNNGSGTVTCAQSTSIYPAGFSNSLSLTVAATDTPAAGDYLLLSQQIEGNNTVDLNWGTANAKTVTVSFWVRSSITGTYGAGIRGGTSFQSYPFTYTINSANTWEQKTATIAGPTTGTFDTGIGLGFQVIFDLGSGSNFNGTANTWQAGSYWRTSGCVNWVSNSAATFYMTGLQVEVGTVATSFDFRSIGTELALCQRYYQKAKARQFWGVYEDTAVIQSSSAFPVEMRASPTVTRLSDSTWGTAGGDKTNTTSFLFSASSPLAAVIALSLGASSGAVGRPATCSTNGFIDFSAEL
jgi:hypothetical protein